MKNAALRQATDRHCRAKLIDQAVKTVIPREQNQRKAVLAHMSSRVEVENCQACQTMIRDIRAKYARLIQ